MTEQRSGDTPVPEAIYVWLVPSASVLEQPGSWRIRKWDTDPFPEATHTVSRSATRGTFEDGLEAAAEACEQERVSGETGDEGDKAYNLAIEHSVKAIRSLKTEARASTEHTNTAAQVPQGSVGCGTRNGKSPEPASAVSPSSIAPMPDDVAASYLDEGFSIKVLNPERDSYWRCPHCEGTDRDVGGHVGHVEGCLIRRLVEAARFTPSHVAPTTKVADDPEPDCHKCAEGKMLGGWPWSNQKMFLCPICGNKRCPKASDHDLACTGSNESGQPGSIYTRSSTGRTNGI